MRSLMWFPFFILVAPSTLLAQQPDQTSEQENDFHAPNHLSVFLGDTHIKGEGDNFTTGVDYEYRLNQLLGIGAVVEKANGHLDAVTVLAVADIHLNNGLIFQVGPGFERSHHENIFLSRIGALYEFELERYTLSPQLHWDYHEHGHNAVVVGVAFGVSF